MQPQQGTKDPELRICLPGLSGEEASLTFLHVGLHLQALSDKRLACIGSKIVAHVTGADPEGICAFCQARRNQGLDGNACVSAVTVVAGPHANGKPASRN